jgi:hypothetical protein
MTAVSSSESVSRLSGNSGDRRCSQCGSVARMLCSGCKVVYYCSVKCQVGALIHVVGLSFLSSFTFGNILKFFGSGSRARVWVKVL